MGSTARSRMPGIVAAGGKKRSECDLLVLLHLSRKVEVASRNTRRRKDKWDAAGPLAKLALRGPESRLSRLVRPRQCPRGLIRIQEVGRIVEPGFFEEMIKPVWLVQAVIGDLVRTYAVGLTCGSMSV